MSEPEEDGVELPVQPVMVVDSTDWFLRSIIEGVVAHGVELGITLTVGGTTVAGTLISGRTYFEELGDTVSAGSDESDIKAILGNSWKGFTAIYDEPEGAPEGWQAPPASYIHLRNAKVFVPGQMPMPQPGVLWRGKLASVDGFAIGAMTATVS